MEAWKDIPGYEGTHQASDLGRIRSLTGGRWGKDKGMIVCADRTKLGYMRVRIRGKTEYVHRLVAKAFHGYPDGLLEVDHIDCNKENNQADNLRWVTHKKNIHAAIALKGNWFKERRGK